MKSFFNFYIAIILFWLITPGFQCGEPRPQDCDHAETDTVQLSYDVLNQAAVFHVLDTIKIFTRISDTLHIQSGGQIIIPIERLGARIQAYKVDTATLQFDYANIDFNPILTVGTYASPGNSIYITFDRAVPYNTAGLSLVAGYEGLYLVVVDITNYGYSEYYSQFIKDNNYCHIYQGYSSLPAVKQNEQYWDSLGTASLMQANLSSYIIHKADKNYFFLKVEP